MKNFKRLTLVMGIALTMVCGVALNSAHATEAVCKTEIIDCPGWGTGDRVVCHVNGGGITCTCGDSTKCKTVSS